MSLRSSGLTRSTRRARHGGRGVAVIVVAVALMGAQVALAAGPVAAAPVATTPPKPAPAPPITAGPFRLPNPPPATPTAPSDAPTPPATAPPSVGPIKAPPLPKGAPGTVAQSESYTVFSHATTHTDGSVTEEISPKPAHFQDAAGAWHNIDPTLVADVDGSLKAKAAGPGSPRFGKVAATVSVPTGTGTITLAHPGAPATAAVAQGHQASYAGAVPGSGDVVEALTTDGFEETLNIAGPGTSPTYRDEFTLPAGTTARQADDAVEFVDARGAVVGRFGGGIAHDSGPQGGATTPVTVRLVATTGPIAVVEVDVDAAWLAGQVVVDGQPLARVYPIAVDPTYSANTASDGSGSYDGFVDLKNPDSTAGWANPHLYLGSTPNGPVARSYIYFGLGSLFHGGAQVTEAHVAVYNDWSNTCDQAGGQIQLSNLRARPDYSTTWNNQPYSAYPSTVTSAALGNACGVGGGWVNLDATVLAQRWADVNGYANNGVQLEGLYNGNESLIEGAKTLYAGEAGPGVAPTLVVNYNTAAAPGAPTNVAATAGNAQATITWTPPAYGGTQPIDGYYIYTYTYPAFVAVRTDIGCATCTSFVVPGLTNGTQYAIIIYSHNAVGLGGYGSAVFTPAAPPGPAQAVVANAANGGAFVRWAPPATNGGVAIDGYLVAAYDSVGLHNTVLVCGTCTSTVYTPGLVNGTWYYIYIFAHNAPGGYGAASFANQVNPAATDPMAGAGERPFFTQQSFALTDRMTAKVNVGTGNLEVAVTDVVLPAVSGSLPIGHVYNSLAAAVGSTENYSAGLGYDWRLNQAPDVRLVPQADASLALHSSSANAAVFAHNPDGTYVTPAGLDADLVRAGDGTFSLTYHASAEVQNFAADGNLTKDTDRNANHVDFDYHLDGRRETTIVSTAGTTPGNAVTLTYANPYGHLSSIAQVVDGVTRTASFAYESTGTALNSVTDTAGGITSYGYDGSSNLTQITDPAGRITQFAYDASHRVTSVTRVITGGNAVTGYDYTTPGLTKVTDADGHPPVTYTVDGSGRVTNVTDAFGHPTATTYIADAKVGTFQNASGGITTNSYPPAVNHGESLTQSQQGATGAKVTATYNSPGQPFLPNSVTDTMNNASAFLYSVSGNLASTTANAAMAQLSYNGDGTVATATAPNNAVTTYVPNGVHQLAGVTPPAGGSLQPQSFTYDGAGRLKTSVTGAQVTTTYTYDGLDRVKTEVHTGPVAAPNISYFYDAAGNLTSRSDATGTVGFVYDEANRLKTKNLGGGGTLSYTYDGVGNLLTATDAAGTTTYHYNKANLVDQITEVGGRTDVLAYDADHRRTDTWDATNGPVTYDTLGNTVIAPTGFAAHIHARFDSFGHLIGLNTTRASSDADANRVADLSYSYAVPSGTTCPGETVGNTNLRQSMTDNVTGAVTTYCYDGGARLASATTGGGPTYTYGYDINGNRSSGPEGTHSFNAVNQANDAASAYDANGNLTTSSAFPALAANGVNQTTSITAAGQSALALAYAGTTNDERTTAGTTTFQNGLLGVQSQAAAGATSTFVRDPQGTLVAERIGTDEYYYAFDGTGSVIALVDATGTQRAAYSYDPYGGHATATAMNGALPANPWRYAGGALDTTGLYHFGARYYDPAIGRWTQQDSVVSLGDPGNANRYAYAGDDPVNRVDGSGRNFISDYITGADSDKSATDPSYDNPLSDAEGTAAGDLQQVPGKAVVFAESCISSVGEFSRDNPEAEDIPYSGYVAAAVCVGGGVTGVAISSRKP